MGLRAAFFELPQNKTKQNPAAFFTLPHHSIGLGVDNMMCSHNEVTAS
jgi:hypothetical protein